MRTTLDIVIKSDAALAYSKKKFYKYEKILKKYGELIEKDQETHLYIRSDDIFNLLNKLPYPSVFYPANRWRKQAQIVIADRDWTECRSGYLSDVLI
jgi:hypothetical protein